MSHVLVLLLLLATSVVAEDRPEILRLRVPSDGVKSIFPAGTELRGMSVDEFEALVSAANKGQRPSNGARSSLVKVRHRATWNEGVLLGTTELTLRSDDPDKLAVPLEPWTPAVVAIPAGLLQSSPDRSLSIRPPGQGTTSATVGWEQVARPGSDGRSFDLGLPATAASRLVLDLPEGMVPEVNGTIRQGPNPGMAPDRRSWNLDGRGGVWNLNLRTRPTGDQPALPVWISGTTRIDLSDSPIPWTLDASVECARGGGRRFSLELDAGLDPIDVVGAGVASYRIEPLPGAKNLVSIRLADSVSGPSPITIRALVHFPADAPWTIPAYRPRDAIWTGGRTLVRLGAGQSVSSLRPLAGRQSSATIAEREFGAFRNGLLLAFDSVGVGSPAEIIASRSPLDATTDVRGSIKLAVGEPSRLEARITWRVDRGRLPTLAADLPVGWSPERVQFVATADPTAWHAEARPGGGTRIVLHTPPSTGPGEVIVLDVSAIGSRLDPSKSIDFPRVWPVGGRITDEVWTASSGSGLMISPNQARGLAWLEPSPIEAVRNAATTRPLMSWRWTTADGRGTFSVAPPPTRPQVEAWTDATVRSDRLTLDTYLAIDLRGRTSSELSAAFVGEGGTSPLRWEVVGEPGRDVEATPIPRSEREASGLPISAPSIRIVLPRLGRDRLILHARVERAWTGKGPIPLVVLTDREFARGVLLVNSEPNLAVDMDAPNLFSRDPAWATTSRNQVVGSGDESSKVRAVLAYGYRPESAAPTLRTRTLPPAAPGGVIEQARLLTKPAPGRASLDRLSLRIRSGPDGVVDVGLPEGVNLERSEVDGRQAIPIRRGSNLRFSLPIATPSRPTSVIDIEYRSPASRPNEWSRPNRPQVSLPCLAFSWEMDGLPDTESVEPMGNLLSTSSLLDSTTRAKADDTALILDLTRRIKELPPVGLTLATWLTRLDAGKTPIVVDRNSLDQAGWGPRTPLPDVKNGDPDTVFSNLGLAVTPRMGCIVVSSKVDGAIDLPFDLESIRQAAVNGHDDFDRYQSVSRWRGEPTNSRGRDLAVTSASIPVGLTRVREFVSPGWPSKSAALAIRENSRNPIRGVAIITTLCLGAISIRRRSLRLRSLVLSILLISALVSARLPGRLANDLTPDMLAGCCGASGIWLGLAVRSRREEIRSAHQRTNSGQSRAIGSGVVTGLLLASLFARSFGQQIPPHSTPPILAVIPYDPPFDPNIAATRAILKLSDHDRLRAMAEAAKNTMFPETVLIGAVHEVRREGGHDARVASAFDLRSDEGGLSSWSFPIESARDVSATLDGRDVPLRIVNDGTAAVVEVSGTSSHRLIVKRLVALQHDTAGDVLRLAVPPIATARLRVDAPGQTRDIVEAPTSRGRSEVRDGIFEAAIGPVETLAVSWSDRAAVGPSPPVGVLETLLLWDVEPSGDRIFARFTPRSDQGLDHLTINLEPGLVVRSISRVGALTPRERKASEGTTWHLALEPPLSKGENLQLELWRPLKEPVEPNVRRLPRIEALGLMEVSELVGVRRPSDWTGRVDANLGGETVPDDDFARIWGAFPDAQMTFSGASKVTDMSGLRINVGPPRDVSRVVPTLQLEIAPGRIEVFAEAEVSAESGRLRELSAAIPSDLRLARVEAAGLTDWSRPSDDRLRLRFDGDALVPKRTVRVVGWVPIDNDPLAKASTRTEADVPWLGWLGSDTATGSLSVSAPANVIFGLVPKQGVVPTVPTQIAGGLYRSTFSISPGTAPGKLSWTSEATGVTVRVQSLITLYPGTVEWTASARYVIPAGPCPTIRLRLPAEWASAAIVEINGSPVLPEIETVQGETSWVLRTEKSCWSSARIFVRAVRPRKSGEAMTFPDLIPLGRPRMDRADSYIAYVDTCSEATPVEGSAELQVVDSSKWNADELPWPHGANRHAFRVIKEGWILKFLGTKSSPSKEEGTAATSASIQGSVDSDGDFVGRVTYDLEARPGRSFIIALPEGSEPLAATVDGQITIARRDDLGHILIPLSEDAHKVAFAWRESIRDGDTKLPMPTLPGQAVPTLLDISAPDRSRLKAIGMSTEIDQARRHWIHAENESRELIDGLARFDRGSSRDRENLLAALIRFEMSARSAERAAGAGEITSLEGIRRLRSSVFEALTTLGLEDFGKSAASRVGSRIADPLPNQLATPEAPEPLRIRPLGPSFLFHDAGGANPPVIEWSPPKHDEEPTSSVLSVALGVLPFLALPGSRKRPRLAAGLMGLLTLMASLVGLELVWSLGALTAGVMIGRFSRF